MPDHKLSAAALSEYDALRLAAIEQVTQAFYSAFGEEYARFGERGKRFCREDIGFHLDFLRPVLDTGMLEPYSDYLRWFNELLAARGIPANHTGHTLTLMGNFFRAAMAHEGELVAQALQEAYAAYQAHPELQIHGGNTLAPWPELEAFEAALLRGDHRSASAIFEDLRNRGRSLVEIEVHLVEAALCNVGTKWHRNAVSVAQEHLATATARTVMARAFTTTTLAPLTGKKALFACVEGNQHSVGLNMISDAYELDGWEVQFLGANTPTQALVQQASAWKPDLIGLSVAFAHQLPAAREAVAGLRKACGATPPRILVGGGAIKHFPALAQYMGADGHSFNALDAVANHTASRAG